MSDDDSSWAPFGPAGDDEPAQTPAPPPDITPAPEPEPEPETEPEPDLPPAAAFEPPVAAPMPVLPTPAPPPPTPPPVSAWQGAAPAAFGTPAKVPGNATASLVLGIVGLVFCPVIASVAAISLGHSAKREIRDNPGMGGEGMASWGIGLGWVGVFFGVLVVAAIIAGAGSKH